MPKPLAGGVSAVLAKPWILAIRHEDVPVIFFRLFGGMGGNDEAFQPFIDATVLLNGKMSAFIEDAA
jgi:hypothetical protein